MKNRLDVAKLTENSYEERPFKKHPRYHDYRNLNFISFLLLIIRLFFRNNVFQLYERARREGHRNRSLRSLTLPSILKKFSKVQKWTKNRLICTAVFEHVINVIVPKRGSDDRQKVNMRHLQILKFCNLRVLCQ